MLFSIGFEIYYYKKLCLIKISVYIIIFRPPHRPNPYSPSTIIRMVVL